MTNLYSFLSGAAMLGAWVCGLFFLKIWAKTKDRLFLMFGAAFWVMALERFVLVFLRDTDTEDRSMVYLIRLVAFVLIIAAVIDKNRKDLT